MVGDQYGIYKNNKTNWLMQNDKNNGDVTNIDNLYDFENKLGRTIDLYTHDLGIDVSDKYEDQEKKNIKAHLGAALSGLMVLKLGGNFLAKQYTLFQEL